MSSVPRDKFACEIHYNIFERELHELTEMKNEKREPYYLTSYLVSKKYFGSGLYHDNVCNKICLIVRGSSEKAIVK